jgi:hypothetical protein
LLENLTNALRDTPFSAVVQYIRKDVTPLEDDEVKVTYQVRVLEPIRGPKLEKLSYFAVVEKGEDTSFEKRPVILTLCKGKQGYYWPGTGAEFPRTKSTQALVARSFGWTGSRVNVVVALIAACAGIVGAVIAKL